MQPSNDWKKVTLGEIAKYINGKAFKPKEWSRAGLPIIRIQNLNKEKSEFNYCNFIVDQKYYVETGDLLFAWSGTPDTSFGAHIWKGPKAVLNQHIFRIEIDKSLIEKKYYLYALNHKVKEFVNKSHGTAGLAHITKRKFEESEIYLPPKETQQAIVSKIEELFSELDKGIENLRLAQQQLKTYRQSILKWAFEGKLTRKEIEEGQLPKGWKWTTLKEIKEFSIYGPRFSSKDYSEEGVAVLRTTDISDAGKVDWINSPKLKLTRAEYEKYKLIPNDLLITRTGSIGRLSVFNDDKKAIPGAFLIHYRLKHPINVWYIFYFLKSEAAQKHFVNHSFGVGRPNLNVPNIELLQIPLPPLEEQDKIIGHVEEKFSVADKLEESINQSLQQAEALRKSILKKAFEGNLI